MHLSKCFPFISLFLCLIFLGLSADYATNSTYLDLTSTISDLSHDCDYAPLSKDCDQIKKSKNLKPSLLIPSSEVRLSPSVKQTSGIQFAVSIFLASLNLNHPSRAPPVSRS